MLRSFLVDRWDQVWFAAWQHFSLVAQSLLLATALSLMLAFLVHGRPKLGSLASGISAVGLTIPSFALIGLLVVPLGFGVLPSVVVVTFYATRDPASIAYMHERAKRYFHQEAVMASIRAKYLARRIHPVAERKRA